MSPGTPKVTHSDELDAAFDYIKPVLEWSRYPIHIEERRFVAVSPRRTHFVDLANPTTPLLVQGFPDYDAAIPDLPGFTIPTIVFQETLADIGGARVRITWDNQTVRFESGGFVISRWVGGSGRGTKELSVSDLLDAVRGGNETSIHIGRHQRTPAVIRCGPNTAILV